MGQRDYLDRPRLILWLGSAFSADPTLLADLYQLPLVAVFSVSTDTAVQDTLLEKPPLSGRYPLALTTADEAANWNPASLPIFYLRGRQQDASSSPMRDQHRRAAMLERFSPLATEYRPSVIALGMDSRSSEIEELLIVATEYGSFTPVIIVGESGVLTATARQIRSESSSTLVDPDVIDGNWSKVRQQLESAGVSLLMDEDERTSLLVGQTNVPLDEIFADPETKIDHTWRLITTKALRQDPAPDFYESMFHAVMRLDETTEARQVEEDFREWWGIGDGFLADRPSVRAATDEVLRALRGQFPREQRNLWVAAEAGSGTTMFLHSVAYRVAMAGFPTFVLKQHARDPASRQLHDFLARVKAMAAQSTGDSTTEVSALVVIDVPHTFSSEIDDLPDYLRRQGGHRVIAIRAARIDPEYRGPQPGEEPAEWLARKLRSDDADRRLPRKEEPVVAILRATPTEGEIQLVDQKARWLREKRGINLFENPSDTWETFRKRQPVFVDALLRNAGLSGADLQEAHSSFNPTLLFWEVLYYFLRNRDHEAWEQPLLGSLARRLAKVAESKRYLESGHDAILGVLLETAKLFNWGIATPVVALVDWVRERRVLHGRVSNRNTSEKGRLLEPSELSDAAQRLRTWAAGERTFQGLQEGISPELETSCAIDHLVSERLLRRHAVNGIEYATVPTPTLARAILLAAFSAPDTVGLKLHESLGGLDPILLKDKAFENIGPLLSCLTAAQPNFQLCQDLSERLLKGDNESSEWIEGKGESRLAAYEMIPAEIRNRSRVLSHHWAMALRRSAFSQNLDDSKKVERLLLARDALTRALSLPWTWGERDDHPAFVQTSLGLVHKQLAELIPDNANHWLEQARAALRAGLLEKPNSRHTRLALAAYCMEEAERRGSNDEQSVALAAECLRLLSVEPTGQRQRWYNTKHDAVKFFGSEAGNRFVESLCERGVEDGFLLKAELAICDDPESIRVALEILGPLIAAPRAPNFARACRRAAELMLQHEEFKQRFEERYRLLSLVEIQLQRLTPIEDFQLAHLAYQLGDFTSGRRRFTLLRATGRSIEAAGEEQPFLMDPKKGTPLRCRGVVIRVEGGRGWMQLEREAGGERLFETPFLLRHFADEVRPRQQFRALVRFSEKGPIAIPESVAKVKRT